jgi:alpha-tubulin suppressor-like RCC1 family protein
MKIKLLLAVFSIASIVLMVSIGAKAQTIAAGAYHSLAVCSDNTARTWGYNNRGELGNGTNANSNVPVQVSGLTGIIAIAGGGSQYTNNGYSLALKNDGTVRAWGWNTLGQLGNGTNTDSNIPVTVSSLTGVSAIAAGNVTSLALKNDGTVRAWGYNGQGQLGNGNNTDSNVPISVSSLTGITAISAGSSHSLALKNDGTVRAWGQNLYGQLGNGSNTDSNVPVQVTGLAGIIRIAEGEQHSLALKNDGTVWTWGWNTFGQLGNGSTTDSNVPRSGDWAHGNYRHCRRREAFPCIEK